MKKLSLDDVKRTQLGIMDTIHLFAEENQIEYCLAYGSLLGAIRHQGFIPWDDDIDILMPRKSYEKFLRIFNEKYSKYKVINYQNTDNYPYAFAKVIDTTTKVEEYRFKKYPAGIFIDVFPLDDVGNNLETVQLQGKKMILYNKLLQFKMGRFSYYHGAKLAGLLLAKISLVFINKDWLIKKIDKEAQLLTTRNSIYTAPMVEYECYREREIMEKEWFSEYIKAKFEDREYYIPKDYDKVLAKLYGDYMQLPPKEKQVTHHSFDAWEK